MRFARLCCWALPLLVGCATSPYRQAQKTDTPEAYRAFLAEHPDDPHAEDAQDRLAELDFRRACRLHTIAAYKRFLAEHPRAGQAERAQELLETLRFNAALAAGTALAWRNFLEDEPHGAHHEEALRRLADAQRAHEPPPDPAKADDAAFARAMALGPGSLWGYLHNYPGGSHREEARRELLRVHLEGLMVSGLVEQARQEASHSPLSQGLPNLTERLARAERLEALRMTRDRALAAALPGLDVPPLAQLEEAAQSIDPLDRADAYVEMGQLVTVEAIDPLLKGLREQRNPLIRQSALDSLLQVLGDLPRPVAEYEIWERINKLKPWMGTPGDHLRVAVLFDALGSFPDAAAEYEAAFVDDQPDPLILHRWTQLRRARGQAFSAAVAARRLALWAKADLQGLDPDDSSLATARELCAADREAAYAVDQIQWVRQHGSEFPSDVDRFLALAQDVQRLTRARLQDAELGLRTQNPRARVCADQPLSKRLQAAEGVRQEALLRWTRHDPKLAPLLWELAFERDPSPRIRALAFARRAAGEAAGLPAAAGATGSSLAGGAARP